MAVDLRKTKVPSAKTERDPRKFATPGGVSAFKHGSIHNIKEAPF